MFNKSSLLSLTLLSLLLSLSSCSKDESCTTCTKEANGTNNKDCSIRVCDNSYSTNQANACAGVENFIDAVTGKQARIDALRAVGYTCN